MKNNATKKICSVLLAFTLFLYTAVPVGAADKLVPSSQKEEVVYVKLSHDGRVDTIYVVNSFDMAQDGTITDLGHYSEVQNLTTTEAISYAAGTISVSAPEGRFYYEGVLDTRDIPWDISVEYWLDGKPISGDRLAGQSGRLQIELHIHQNARANPVYTDNYAIQASLALDTERCESIVAEDATVANVGKNKQLSYIILPGKDGDFTITADVVNFEMDGISINGIPLSLSIDDPDTDELKDKITELQDGAIELDDGAWELDDGAQELYDGAVDLDDGATKLDDGAVSLQDGVTELEDGVVELQDGAKDLREGANELWKGTKDLREGVDGLESGVSKLSSGAASFERNFAAIHEKSGALTAASSQILQGFQALEAGVADFSPEALEQMTGQVLALQQGSQQYMDTLDWLIADYERQLAQANPLGASGENPDTAAIEETLFLLKDLRSNYVEINNGVIAMTDVIATQGELIPVLIAGIQELSQQYEVFDENLVLYTQNISSLYAAFGELAAGISELSGGTDKLTDGSKELRDGARELYDGTYDLQDGVSRLSDGVDELRDGATELKDGTQELKDGTVELLDGTIELKDGTAELLDGTNELREKTADMDQEIDDRIDEMLDEYRGVDFEAVSFVDERNTVNSVQFVMLTENIAIDEIPVETTAAEEPAKPTLLQRFLHLFKRN